MTDWKEFWEDYSRKKGNKNLFEQVAKTVGGKPINDEQFKAIIQDIDNHLKLNSNDILLDLCCGNGLITKEIAKLCKKVIAVDSSEFLIEQAKVHCSRKNLSYYILDVLKINELESLLNLKFSKVLCYGSLAYFNQKDLELILNDLKDLLKKNHQILFGSVLNKEKIWNFFNTFKRKLVYIFKIWLLGKEAGLGKWWKKSEIESVCEKLDYKCTFFPQNDILHTSHYRMDIRLTPIPI